MGMTAFDQRELLADRGEYDHEGICYALSLYWIKLHATDFGGQGDTARNARIQKLKKILSDAMVLQKEYKAVSSQFMSSYDYDWTQKSNIARMKIALAVHYCNQIGGIEVVTAAKTIMTASDTASDVSDLVDFMCDTGTYHLLSMGYENGKGHANAVYYGGAWFHADTYLFEPNAFEGDAFNKASLKDFLQDRVKTFTPKIKYLFAIKIKKSAG